MNRFSFHMLSRSELLQLETACDSFERDLRNGHHKPVGQYLDSQQVHLTDIARREFEAIADSIKNQSKHSSQQPIDRSTAVHRHRKYQTGDMLGRFQLNNRIGSGASAEVWSANDRELKRLVAIKLLFHDSVDFRKRFSRESEAVAKLRHPNIVSVHEVNEADRFQFLVCDYIEGESLAEQLEKKSSNFFSTKQTVMLMSQLASAVDYSHSQGVIHRDIKPQNILIDKNGSPLLTDFGLALLTDPEAESLTREGEIIGTPAYMAPEQAMANPTDIRTDVYSLGVVLFQLLTGDLPFRGNVQAVIHQVIHNEPPSARQWDRDVPIELETICRKCMNKNPNDRFQTCGELFNELKRFANDEPILSRPISFLNRSFKWAKRNPMVASLSALVGLLLFLMAVGGTAFGLLMNLAKQHETVLLHEAEQSESRALSAIKQKDQALADALAAKSLAQSQARESDNALGLLQSVFQESDPAMWVLSGDSIAGGEPPSLQTLFHKAALRIQNEFGNEKKMQANLHDTLGNCCRSVGLFDDAKDLLIKASEIREKIKHQYDRTELEFDNAKNSYYQAKVLHDQGLFEEAAKAYEECLKIDDTNRARKLLVARAAFDLGRVRLTLQHPNSSELFRKSLAIQEEHLPKDTLLIRATRIALKYSECPVGQWPSFEDLTSDASGNQWVDEVVVLYANVIRYRNSSPFDKASDNYRKLVDVLRRRFSDRHPLYLLAAGEFSGILWKAGNYSEAFPLIESVIARGSSMAPSHRMLASAEIKLANELLRNGEYKKGLKYFKAAAKRKPALQSDQDQLQNGMLWCNIKLNRPQTAIILATNLLEQEFDSHMAESWAYFSAARAWEPIDQQRSDQLDIQAKRVIDEMKHPYLSGFNFDQLAKMHLHYRQLEQAVRFSRKAIEVDTKNFHENHPRVANRRMTLAKALELQGDLKSAKREVELALRIRQQKMPANHPTIVECQDWMKSLSISRTD